MKKTLIIAAFAALAITSVTPIANAAPEPTSLRGKCAKQAGGSYDPGSQTWRTNTAEQRAKFEKCIGYDALAAKKPREGRGGCRFGNSNSGKGSADRKTCY